MTFSNNINIKWKKKKKSKKKKRKVQNIVNRHSTYFRNRYNDTYDISNHNNYGLVVLIIHWHHQSAKIICKRRSHLVTLSLIFNIIFSLLWFSSFLLSFFFINIYGRDIRETGVFCMQSSVYNGDLVHFNTNYKVDIVTLGN